MKQIYDYTIKLIRYVLNGDIPELPENIDFEKLFAFGKSHGVENMLYVGLRDLNIDVPPDTMKKFQTAYKMQIMVEAKQAFELEAINEAFEKAGIDYVPLKGSVIKYLYPMPDYRKSGDIDILVRNADKDEISNIMSDMGYEIDEVFEHYEVHYAYKKKPFYEVEIHRQLLKGSNRAYKFCRNAWNYMSPQQEGSHQYVMNNEFMYTYLLAHLCNHLYEGGAGIRIFMDFYVVRQKITLDEKLLNEYLRKTNLSDINDMVVKLMKKWFGDSYTEDRDIETLENIVFTNGSFGTEEQKEAFRKNDAALGRVQVLFRRVFLRKALLINRYDYLEDKNWPWLIMWFYRFYHTLRYRKKQMSRRFDETFSNKYHKDGMENIIKAIKEK